MPNVPDQPEILSQGDDIADSAAIVCTHVARDGLPIRLARRDEPVHADDDDAVVWAVRDVVEHDPSVLPILDNPPKMAFRRESKEADWAPEPYENE